MNKDVIDALLKAKWEGMKAALSRQEVEKAITYFTKRSRDRYKMIFNGIQTMLPSIVANMQTIEMIYLENGVAQYRIRKTEEAGFITYYIYFYYDENGTWEIQQF